MFCIRVDSVGHSESTRMQNLSEKHQNIFQTKGKARNGLRTKKSERDLPMPELAIGAWETESLIGNGFRPYGLGINTHVN